jgi:hypothetical protein
VRRASSVCCVCYKHSVFFTSTLKASNNNRLTKFSTARSTQAQPSGAIESIDLIEPSMYVQVPRFTRSLLSNDS